MIKIVGNGIWRGGEKIGWLQEDCIYNHENRKIGYFSGNDIYNQEGRKVGYIEGDYIKTVGGMEIRLEDNREHVVGGGASDLARAAIRLLLGD
jgi:hypothetical protein